MAWSRQAPDVFGPSGAGKPPLTFAKLPLCRAGRACHLPTVHLPHTPLQDGLEFLSLQNVGCSVHACKAVNELLVHTSALKVGRRAWPLPLHASLPPTAGL